MKKQPVVSIVCPTYNHEQYIGQTIEGFLAQKTSFPFEIIIHDDASPDGTAAIVRRYAQAHPDKIKPILQEQNQLSRGVLPFSHIILPTVHSKYVIVCEGDDFWTDPYKLQKQVDLLEQNQHYSFCAHDVQITFEKGSKFKEKFYRKPREGSFEFTFQDQFNSPFIALASALMRTELLKNRPATKYNIAGDLYLFFFLLSHGPGYYFEEKMSVKRRNPGSITHDPKYMSQSALGYRSLLLSVHKFAPKSCKKMILKKVADFERTLALSRTRTENETPLTFGLLSLLHDPMWPLHKLLPFLPYREPVVWK